MSDAPKQRSSVCPSRHKESEIFYIRDCTRGGDHLPRVRTLSTRGARGFLLGSFFPFLSFPCLLPSFLRPGPSVGFLSGPPFFSSSTALSPDPPTPRRPWGPTRYAREDTSPAEAAISHVPPRGARAAPSSSATVAPISMLLRLLRSLGSSVSTERTYLVLKSTKNSPHNEVPRGQSI